MDTQEAHIRALLLQHFRKHARVLPWRMRADAYGVWVSEIMLQQTQVDTVVPRYVHFMGLFPDVHALAAATEDAVAEAWAGLGYYRRARFLHQAAREVVHNHNGVFPCTAEGLIALPGIGRYTAGAVASIVFQEQAPVVDGNVARVFARLFLLPGALNSPLLHDAAWGIAQRMVQGERPGDWNQALMEHGALVCKPSNPDCGACVVRTHCAAYAKKAQALFPAPKIRKERSRLQVAFAWAPASDEKTVWVWRRSEEGLWPGQWELPSAHGPSAKRALAEILGVSLGRCVATVQHDLTHRKITARVYRVNTPWNPSKHTHTPAFRAIPVVQAHVLSGLARKALQAALSEQDGV
jgi:A/G-specific adenine glycosylase